MGNSAGIASNLYQFSPEVAADIKKDYTIYSTRGLSPSEIERVLRMKYDHPAYLKKGAHLQKARYSGKRMEAIQKINAHQKQEIDSKQNNDSFHIEASPIFTQPKRIIGGSHAIVNSQVLAFPRRATHDTSATENEKLRSEQERVEQFAKGNVMDSIPAEPKCFLCNMVFLNMERLDRHLAESTLHAKNVQLYFQEKMDAETKTEIETKEKLEENSTSGVDLVTSHSNDKGVLIYTSSEFYHQSDDNIDFHIYLHIGTKILEIIAYDTNEQKELNRIFLSLPVFVIVLGAKLIKLRSEDMERLVAAKGDWELFSTEVHKQSAKLLAISLEVIRHLDIVHEAFKRKTISFSSSNFMSMSTEKPPLPMSTASSKNQQSVVFERRLVFNHRHEDKSNIDPNVHDPHVPLTVVERHTRPTSIETKLEETDHHIDPELLLAIHDRDREISKRQIENSMQAAHAILACPHTCGIKPTGRRCTF